MRREAVGWCKNQRAEGRIERKSRDPEKEGKKKGGGDSRRKLYGVRHDMYLINSNTIPATPTIPTQVAKTSRINGFMAQRAGVRDLSWSCMKLAYVSVGAFISKAMIPAGWCGGQPCPDPW